MDRQKTTAMLDVAALSLADSPRLETLPRPALHIIFAHLGTAQSIANLALTCRRLYSAVQTDGWGVFVRGHFGTLALPPRLKDDHWAVLARSLTWQSRAWDRRAFSVASLVPPAKETAPRATHGRRRGGGRTQTFPPHIVVDASSKVKGVTEEETVAWGAGEDVVFRRRELKRSLLSSEKWTVVEGGAAGFRSGTDDVTAISILNDLAPGPSLLVGRASGYLQLLSTSRKDFGRTAAWFYPSRSETGPSIEQREIQHFDTNVPENTAAVITKESLLFYPLTGAFSEPAEDPGAAEIAVPPTEALEIRNMQGSREFRLLREVKFMRNGDLALGTTSSSEPLRYLTRTPGGTVITNAAKLKPSSRCTETYIYGSDHPQTLRGLLPVNAGSVAGGSGSVVLSSYDDGTIRLQDLRSSTPIDTIYQDHFELTTPVGPLASYGTERFVVGSARASILKIFDYRWTKGYCYTDALPCSGTPLGPTPKPLTWISPPTATDRERCLHLPGYPCKLHALARTDFHRPSCIVYLPVIRQAASPVYSLVKPSDTSSVIYAGLAGELVKMSLRDPEADQRESFRMHRMGKKGRWGYSYHESLTSVVETGDGIALSDISKSSRVPNIHKQNPELLQVSTRELRRLDELLT